MNPSRLFCAFLLQHIVRRFCWFLSHKIVLHHWMPDRLAAWVWERALEY